MTIFCFLKKMHMHSALFMKTFSKYQKEVDVEDKKKKQTKAKKLTQTMKKWKVEMKLTIF